MGQVNIVVTFEIKYEVRLIVIESGCACIYISNQDYLSGFILACIISTAVPIALGMPSGRAQRERERETDRRLLSTVFNNSSTHHLNIMPFLMKASAHNNTINRTCFKNIKEFVKTPNPKIMLARED